MYSSRLGTIVAVAVTSGLLASAMVTGICAATPVEEQSLKAALEQGSDEAGSEFRQLWRDVEAQTERMIADAIAGWDEPNTVVGDRRELIVDAKLQRSFAEADQFANSDAEAAGKDLRGTENLLGRAAGGAGDPLEASIKFVADGYGSVKVAYLPSAPARSTTARWNVILVNSSPASNATAGALCGVALDAPRAGNGYAPSAHARLIGIPALGFSAMMWMA